MPYINVVVSGQASARRSQEIASKVSQLTAQHLRKDPTVTSISISAVDPQHWFIAGRSLSQWDKPSFWLDIKVVDGTNTKQELSAYVEAIFASLSDLLGGAHEESYVLVHEVPAAAYGFGGKTQEYRFVEGRMKAA